MGNGKRLTKYVLRNTTTSDVMIGDLRYKIPKGQSRDLLSKTAHLPYELVMASRKNGSIAKRLGRSLVEISDVVAEPPKPMIEVVKNDPEKVVDKNFVMFPQRVKSFITIDVGDITEESQSIIANEDEEFLQQLDILEGVSPVVAKKDED